MESAIKLNDLNVILEAARQLDSLLKESPEIAAFAAAVKESREPVLVMPQDRLILAHEAAKILSVNQSMISRYVREGRLVPGMSPAVQSEGLSWRMCGRFPLKVSIARQGRMILLPL